MAANTISRTYSYADLCELLGCERTTLWRKVRAGKIRPPRDIAGLKRWTDEDVTEIFGEDQEAA